MSKEEIVTEYEKNRPPLRFSDEKRGRAVRVYYSDIRPHALRAQVEAVTAVGEHVHSTHVLDEEVMPLEDDRIELERLIDLLWKGVFAADGVVVKK